MKNLLLFITLTFAFIDPVNSQYKITNFTDMNQINQLVEDGDYIWVCTSGGAFKRRKSDGSLTTVFNTTNSGIARNRVECMYIDFYGNYWFGTNWGGISMFDGSEWTTYDYIDGFRISDCRTITEDINGNLWFGINDGHVLKYDGANWENIDLQGEWYVGSILSDDDGNIWMGVPGIHGSLYKMDGDGEITRIHGPANVFDSNGVSGITKDRYGNIWFSSGYGVYRYNLLSDYWTDFSSTITYNNYCVTQGSSGNIFVGSAVGVYEYNGSTWTHYTSGESGDRADMVFDVLCDAQNNIWVGSYNGLAKIVPGNPHWTSAIRINALQSNYVETMSFTKNGTARLFGQFSYMIGYSNDYWWETSPGSGCSYGWIKNSVSDEYDNTWISFCGYDSIVKLIRYSPKNVATCFDASAPLDFADNQVGFVNDMVYDPEYNLIWIATDKGLIWFNPKNGSHFRWAAGDFGIPVDEITNVKVHNGVVWFTPSGNGLAYYDIKKMEHGLLNQENGLPTNLIDDLVFDSNGGLNFLSGYKIYKRNRKGYSSFTLPTFYQVMAADSLNNIWVGGYYGAAKFNGEAVQQFTTEDGLNENSVYKIVVAPNNDVWLCSGYFGITRIRSVAPAPDFDTPKTCLPEMTHLTNTSSQTDTLTRYAWDIGDDGTTEYTTRDFDHLFTETGKYKIGLTATNDNKTAHVVKEILILDSPDAAISPTGEAGICSGDKIRIEAKINNTNPDLSYKYHWNTGSIYSQIVTDTSGIYFFDVNNGRCTSRSDTVVVHTTVPFGGAQICMVTVDAEENRNMIVWDPPAGQGITSYNIYKLFGNSYVPIGNVPAGDPSFFVDYNSAPDAQAARYAISVIDTCGNESEKSPYHQTIHLGASLGAQENTIVLDWTPYVDESGNWQPEWYYIYRGASADRMVIHDSISSSFTEWNDLDPGDNRFYQTSVRKEGLCYISTKKASGGPFAHSLSNLEDNKLRTGMNNLQTKNISVYPNPFHDQTTLRWINPDHVPCRIVVTDIGGKVVREAGNITGDEYTLKRNGLDPGMYFVTVTGTNTVQAKIVIR